MTIRTALAQGTSLLEQSSIPAPRLTAEVLLSHALQKDRSWLYAHSGDDLTELGWIHYGRYLYQRMEGMPTQYITKKQEFYGREFRVTPDVLIPRPETEHLIEVALRLAPNAREILDIGCGSGAIAITLALETQATVFATDLSPQALAIAHQNATTLNAPVHFVNTDLATPFAPNSFDLIVSNPPYVPSEDLATLQTEVRNHEPHLALDGGPAGLNLYRRIINEVPSLLHPGAYLILELGFNQSEAVQAMLLPEHWRNITVTPDLSGIPRILSGQRSAA